MKLSGQTLYYFIVCKRKCYLSYNGVRTEHTSDLIKIGKYLHEIRQQSNSEKLGTENVEIDIEGIKIDSIQKEYVIEYKKRNSSLEATKAQLLFYLYKLKQKGVIKKGKLIFKENRDNITLELDEKNEKWIKSIIKEAKQLLKKEETPPVINLPKCKNCAFYDYCYS